MRNSFSNFRDPVPGRRRLLIATLVVLAVFLVDAISGGMLRGSLRIAASTLWRAGSSMMSSIAGTGLFSSRRALQEENDEQRHELERLREREASYELAINENASLRALVHLAQREAGITAPVISSIVASPYGTFLIGAGAEDGIRGGDLVLAASESGLFGESGIVLGLVSDVRRRSSLVTLVFSPEGAAEGSIGGASLEVEGRGGGNARAEAPRGVAIDVGDIVTSTSFGGRAIGVVGLVESDADRAFQKVYIGLPIGLSEVHYVYVVPPAQ